MTSHAFDIWKQAALGTGTRIDFDADDIRMRVLNIVTDYPTPDFTVTTTATIPKYSGTTDQVLSVVSVVITSAGNVVAVDSSNDPVWSAVAISAGKTIGGVLLYKRISTDNDGIPILYIDNFTAITPNGGDITGQIDNGNNRIISLSG